MPRTAAKGEPLDSELSCRLTTDQKARIKAAAAKLGRRPSDFVREAALAQAEHILGTTDPLAAWQDFVGLVDVPSSSSHDTGSAFTELLQQKHSTRRRHLS